jgi:hypothetical protein
MKTETTIAAIPSETTLIKALLDITEGCHRLIKGTGLWAERRPADDRGPSYWIIDGEICEYVDAAAERLHRRAIVHALG